VIVEALAGSMIVEAPCIRLALLQAPRCMLHPIRFALALL